MLMVMWGTVLLVTALIIFAPSLMIPPCSYVVPTMYPVVLCRKINGVLDWFARRMNSQAFFASSLKSTPRAFARIPTGKPCIEAQPVTRLVPYNDLYSPKRD